jgi:PIN domain nuclease of toxin-antitoxin system
MVLLDTHIWLWWLLGEGPLTADERMKLDVLAEKSEIAISWVNIWETEMLERKGRIKLLPDLAAWISQASDPSFCTVLPVDIELVLAQRELPEYFHADPADRLIVASAVLAQIPLATYDSRIVNYQIPNLRIWRDNYL